MVAWFTIVNAVITYRKLNDFTLYTFKIIHFICFGLWSLENTANLLKEICYLYSSILGGCFPKRQWLVISFIAHISVARYQFHGVLLARIYHKPFSKSAFHSYYIVGWTSVLLLPKSEQGNWKMCSTVQ